MLLLLVLLISPLSTGHRAQASQIKVEVDAVYVNAVVVDRNGKPLVGLKKEDFRLYDNNVEQKIEHFFPVDAPFSVGLVLDTSYSTVGKLALIQDAAIGFLKELHPQDEVMVISFDQEVYLETDFTRNQTEAERAVKQTRTGENTHLYDAVYLALEEFKNEPYRKVMIVFTDGVDTASDTSADETLKLVKETEVAIYAIYFDTQREALKRALAGPQVPVPNGTPPTIPGQSPIPPGPLPSPFPVPAPVPRRTDPKEREEIERRVEQEYSRAKSYLSALAEETAGVRIDVSSDLGELDEAFAKIAEEMRRLYTLAYVPQGVTQDGKYHEIKIKMNLPDARVRARKGYYSKKK